MVRYIYDAWGNHAVVDANGNDIEDMSHIGNVNPFRYRGYYYDVETGFYYLKSRYYDPETGRFISQDSIDYADPESINGLNLYAYCGNNPVMNVDPTGTFFLACLIVGLIVGAIAGAVIGGVQAAEAGYTGWDLVGAIFMGAVIGGAFGAMAGALVGLGGAMIGSGLSAISGAGGLLALAGGGTAAAAAAAGVASVGLGVAVVGGGLAIAGLGVNALLGTISFFASNGRPGDNKRQNEQFKSAMDRLDIKRTDPRWREAHDALHGEPPMGFKELLKFIKELFGL